MLTRPRQVKHIVRSGDLKLNVCERGAGDIPCLFIHGLADGGFVWDDFSSAIEPYFRSYMVDLRGHGDSDWDVAKNYSLHAHLKDVEIILDHLQLKNFLIIGHSLGGVIAAGILERRPNDVLGAVLVDTSPISDGDVRNHLREQLLQGYREFGSVEEYSRWLQQKCPLVSLEVAGLLAKNCLLPLPTRTFRPKFDIDVASILLADDAEEQRIWSRLHYFKRPILIVRGAGSAILSRQVADDLVKKLPLAKLVVVGLAGHSVMNDNPPGFSDAVRPFLNQFRKIH